MKVKCRLCGFMGSSFGSMVVHYGNYHPQQTQGMPGEENWPKREQQKASKMKKVVITVYGQDYKALSEAAEHAAHMLALKSPSENTEWEDKSRVDYIVLENADQEYKEIYGEES